MADQDDDQYSNSPHYDYLQYRPQPINLLFFLGAILFFLVFKWYINYETMYEDLMEQLKLCLIIFPLLLVLVVHWLSSENKERVPFFVSLPAEQEAVHKVGGSPIGVALLLTLLLFMVSHHASVRERWFPSFSR